MLMILLSVYPEAFEILLISVSCLSISSSLVSLRELSGSPDNVGLLCLFACSCSPINERSKLLWDVVLLPSYSPSPDSELKFWFERLECGSMINTEGRMLI